MNRWYMQFLAIALLTAGFVCLPAAPVCAQAEAVPVVDDDGGEDDNTGLWGLLGLLGLIGLAGLARKDKSRHVDVHTTHRDPNARVVEPEHRANPDVSP